MNLHLMTDTLLHEYRSIKLWDDKSQSGCAAMCVCERDRERGGGGRGGEGGGGGYLVEDQSIEAHEFKVLTH